MTTNTEALAALSEAVAGLRRTVEDHRRMSREAVAVYRALEAERAAAADECFRQIARWADDLARFAAGECAAAIRARKDSE